MVNGPKENNGLSSMDTVISNQLDIKDKYLRVFNVLPYASIILDNNDNVVQLNSKASFIFRNVDVQKILKDIIMKSGSLNSDDKDNLDKVVESEFLTEDGLKYYKITFTSITNEDEFSGTLVSLNDVTEYKLLEDKLRTEKEEAEVSDINKTKFLANVSHEIRTSINGIIGMTDLTLMSDLNLEQKENLNLVKSSSLKLLCIVNSILEFSKVQSGKIKLENVEFSFNELINEIVRISTIKALEKKLEFNSKIDNSIPDVLVGDPIKLKQIMDNLIDNAIKFTGCGDVSLVIEKEEIGDDKIDLKVQIKDTGTGINKKDIPKLFKSYSQLSNRSYTTKFNGTGLGLFICKGLIEMMGGKIEARSKKDGGSIFSFNVILEKGKKYVNGITTNRKSKEVQNNKINKRLNILVVEDDKASQMVIYNVLKRNGHICDVVGDGQKALKMVENKRYDLIFMDIQMPVMDGVETTKIIRKLEKKDDKHVPIIALTAYALKGDREKFMSVGMDDYISKPFNINELLKVIYGLVKDDNDSKSTNKYNNTDGAPLLLYLL